MGFEAYTVVLVPKQTFLAGTGQSIPVAQNLVKDLLQRWPLIRSDEEELKCLSYPLMPGQVCLVYETAQGLFQMLTPGRGQVTVSIRFAYCNPRTVYKPFIEIIVWLMERYEMCASVMASDDISDLTDFQQAEDVLIPSMDYNRRLWQADVGTNEEAILRPGDAIIRFMSPHYLSAALP